MADCTPQALAAAASCLRCLPKRRPVRTYLLCQWANLTPEPTACTDPDALAFIARAGITDQTQIDAVCALTVALKNTGTPSFWSRDIIIYPMIGPLAPNPYQHHRVNLKTALSSPGLYDFVQYPGATPTYVAGGVQGNGANAFVNTAFIPAVGQKDSIRFFVYLDTPTTFGSAEVVFGADNTFDFVILQEDGFGNYIVGVNDADGIPVNASPAGVGATVSQRIDANTVQFANASDLVWEIIPPAGSTNIPPFEITLLATNQGVGPNPAFFSAVTISGFSVGSPFASDAERLQYKAIWDTFETAVGRGHP